MSVFRNLTPRGIPTKALSLILVLALSSAFAQTPPTTQVGRYQAQQPVRYSVFDGQAYLPTQLEAASQTPIVSKGAGLTEDGSSYWIPRAHDGHYYAPGSVNGFPVVFMVDTGASHSVIPSGQARNFGIRAGKEIRTKTAAGDASASESSRNRVAIGPFVIPSATILATPNTSSSLLGMSALAHFDISTDSNGMYLTPKKRH